MKYTFFDVMRECPCGGKMEIFKTDKDHTYWRCDNCGDVLIEDNNKPAKWGDGDDV